MSKRFESRLRAVVKGLAPAVRGGAVEELDNLRDAGVTSLEAMVELVQSSGRDPELRSVALWFMGQLRGPELAPAIASVLLGLLEDPEPLVRTGAARALGDQGSVAAVPRLCRILERDWSPAVTEAAAYALGQLGDRRAVEPMLRVFGDGSLPQQVRGAVAEQLGNLGDPRSVGALTRALADPAPQVRFWAAFALGELGCDEALPLLEQLAVTDNTRVPGWWSVGKEAADAVEKIRTQAVR